MNEQLHIAGFAGSLRSQSYNRRLLEIAAELMPPGMRLEILDIDLPMYNPDLESQPLPEPVRRFREGVARADGLLIATPEYNHSIPAVLKNALEWLSRPLPDLPASGKLAAIMGAGDGLAPRAPRLTCGRLPIRSTCWCSAAPRC